MDSKETKLSCTYPAPELRQRKVTIIAGINGIKPQGKPWTLFPTPRVGELNHIFSSAEAEREGGLKNLLMEKQEISDGFIYTFGGSDQTLDLLNNFIRTERLCCDFFTFRLTVADPESPAWLGLSGPEGAKVFIENELEF